MKNILILCTGNSCRSIMAEAMINHYLGDSFKAYSAGVLPSTVNPKAIEVLTELGIDTQMLRSKSVAEFMDRDDLDLLITVCDHARETCPVFFKPVAKVHLGIEDPAPYTQQENAIDYFRNCRSEIRDKILGYMKTL